MFGWRVPAPNEAILISGRKKSAEAPFRVIIGHGVFVAPILNKVSWMDLSLQEASVQEPCTTKQGINVSVKAVIAFKVGDDPLSITNAARRFLDDQQAMPAKIGQIFAGHLRSVVGSMTVEDIIRERQKLAEEVLDASKLELEKLGLIVDSFQIQSIDDMGSNYIKALSAPQVAAVQQAAATAQAQAEQQTKIAQANAIKAASQVEQESMQAQISFEQTTAIAQAEADAAVTKAKAEAEALANTAKANANAAVNKATAEAAAAGPLAQAKAQQAVTDEQVALAVKQAELKEQELLSSVTKPAEAEAKKIGLLAEANAKQTKLQAEAMAAGQGVTIQQLLVEKMPEIIGAAASQLSNANITVLNGADGMSELVTGLASQAGNLLSLVRKSLAVDEVAQPAGILTEKAQVQAAK
jgi:uncharacterized membrane protein YqiK